MPNTVEIRPLSRGWKRHLLQEQVSLVVISKRKALLTRRNKKRAQQVLSILLSSDQILFNGSIITWKLSIYETTRRLSLYILEVYLKFLALELLWCLTQFYLKPTHVLQAFCVILYLAVGQYKYLNSGTIEVSGFTKKTWPRGTLYEIQSCFQLPMPAETNTSYSIHKEVPQIIW